MGPGNGDVQPREEMLGSWGHTWWLQVVKRLPDWNRRDFISVGVAVITSSTV